VSHELWIFPLCDFFLSVGDSHLRENTQRVDNERVCGRDTVNCEGSQPLPYCLKFRKENVDAAAPRAGLVARRDGNV